jgi:hypothetical protein
MTAVFGITWILLGIAWGAKQIENCIDHVQAAIAKTEALPCHKGGNAVSGCSEVLGPVVDTNRLYNRIHGRCVAGLQTQFQRDIQCS